MWYICYDKETNDVRRVIELSSQAKADVIQKYRMSEALKEKPDVKVVPEPILLDAVKNEREKALEVLGLTEEDLNNVKSISVITKDVSDIKAEISAKEIAK